MFHYVVWRDKDGDVREVRRYRKATGATEARDRHLAKHGPHSGQSDEQPDVRIYEAESFDILLANHPDFDVWGADALGDEPADMGTADSATRSEHGRGLGADHA